MVSCYRFHPHVNLKLKLGKRRLRLASTHFAWNSSRVEPYLKKVIINFFLIKNAFSCPILGLAHCASCELTSNLWLCLTCGALGCGRAQFGGIGGNGHALAHFNTTQHPVCVKLGTITPEGGAGQLLFLVPIICI